MYYSNGSQATSNVGSFQGNQQYAVMPRHLQHHRQQFVDQQQQQQPTQSHQLQQQQQQQSQSQQQQRQVMQSQYTPNTQFMQMPMTSVNQNFVNSYSGVPSGYQSFGYSAPQRQSVPIPSNDDRYRKQLIVNYLAPDVTSAELHEIFSRFGPLDGARIIYDRQTNLPKGYGFVYFAHPENAKEAVERMNGFEFHGKRLKVGYSTNPLNIVSSVHTQYTHGAIV